MGTRANLALTSGYRRSANQLTLDLLSIGDPAAPFGSVFRWDAGAPIQSAGPLVARVGPGTGGDSTFSAIDPGLTRPHTDEFTIALEASPSHATRFAVAGIARREASLVNLVNVGAPAAAYRMFSIPDANVDLIGTADDRPLPVYDRLPETFGRDRYVLTNPPQEPATMGALVVSAQVATPRLFLLLGATASASVGQASSRGFRATENDQDAIGEIFTNPNALTNARGRLFSDRAYTIKWTTVYRFPKDIRLGAIARYQDGQPFSRLVIVPGLAQGAEAVQAFANGRSRFAFTGTLDIRLQKGFRIGSSRVDAIADLYNVLDMRKEVEEYVVTGDRFRTANRRAAASGRAPWLQGLVLTRQSARRIAIQRLQLQIEAHRDATRVEAHLVVARLIFQRTGDRDRIPRRQQLLHVLCREDGHVAREPESFRIDLDAFVQRLEDVNL